ncbi:MAG: hypothetical protein ACI97R_001722, partial [Candidatus Azotimanducaceae bacterium]
MIVIKENHRKTKSPPYWRAFNNYYILDAIIRALYIFTILPEVDILGS